MIFQVSLRALAGDAAHLFGASSATAHLAVSCTQVAALPAATDDDARGPLLVFDFHGVESVTASYLKALVFPFSRDVPVPGPASKLNAFPLVARMGSGIREELVELAQLSGRTVLEALDFDGTEVRRAQLHGRLDPALKESLELLSRLGRGTAPQLHAAADKDISVTAWNNRLSDLHSRRLARREREGKRWVYESVVPEVRHG